MVNKIIHTIFSLHDLVQTFVLSCPFCSQLQSKNDIRDGCSHPQRVTVDIKIVVEQVGTRKVQPISFQYKLSNARLKSGGP